MWTLPNLRAADRVVVRSKEEILATLEADGTLEGMPFMPEMLQYCGQQLTVAGVAHKTCDTAHRTGGRKLDRTVHLAGCRCDGRAHGGCDAQCTIFWKEQWLRRADEDPGARTEGALAPAAAACTETRLQECTRADGANADLPRYRCQATQLFAATQPLRWWNLRQYVYDVRTGNARPGEMLRVLWLNAVYRLRYLPAGFRIWSALYEWMHRRLTGRHGPFVIGRIEPGEATPAVRRELESGELVRIRPADEIAATLNRNNLNRGMWFGPDQVPYCGGTFRVRKRVARILDERSGEMRELKTPCVTLDEAICRGHYSEGRFFCPRAILPYWREIWLERAAESASKKP